MNDHVFEALHEPVLVFDRSGRPLRVNRAAWDLFRMPAHDISADDYLHILRALRARTLDGLPFEVEDLPSRRVLAGESTAHASMIVTSPEGEELFLEKTANAVVQHGDPVAAVVVIRDITAERRAQEALRQQAEELARADRAKDEFLSTLSHELRTPLSAILVWAHLLLNAELDAEARRRAEEAILRNAEAQRELINEILDVSRIVSGKLRLRRSRVKVRDVVRAAVDVSRAAAEAKHLNLVVHAESDAEVIGDPGRLQQIVTNVLGNALKFTPDGGTVTIQLAREAADVRLRVRDTGIGIAPDFLPRIFDRFTQQDSSASRQHGGLGLGLAIVRHLVEVHGGTITAESEGEGRGAAFTVTLPACTDFSAAGAAGEGAEPGPAEGQAIGLAGIRVLAVDDDADARELLATALTILGAEVVVAASADEALSALPEGRFDVLLADLGMPGTDGYAFIQTVRGLPGSEGRIPAIAVTAFGRKQDRARALAAGYQAHLAKPVLPDQLAAAIAWFVAQHRAHGGRT